MSNTWTPEYARWRHGGWYVTNVHYPRGGVGCVSQNYSDGKWRIARSEAYPGSPTDRTFRTRDDAARAERELAGIARVLYGDMFSHAEPQQTQLPPVSVASVAFPLYEIVCACGETVTPGHTHTLPLDEPVNVPADPDVEPQPYDMPSPEADALDRIAEARWDYRDNSTDGMARLDAAWFAATVGSILRETGRL